MTKKRLILIALAILILVSVKKARSQRRSDWHGLTESEARSKLEAKLPGRIPDDKRSEITDKIVSKMRDRGVIREDAGATGDASGSGATEDSLETDGAAAELVAN